MGDFLMEVVLSFSMSLGMLLGGALLGALGALLAGGYPATTMLDLAERLKIWAAVASLGGTFTTIRILGSVLSGGQFPVTFKQLSLIISAFGGAHLGYLLIQLAVKSP